MHAQALAMRIGALAASVSLGACSPTPSAEPAASALPPYQTEIDTLEAMVHGVDPAAKAFWLGWREVWDETGYHDLSAKTDEDWKRVEDGATTLALLSNALMLPHSQREPRADWLRYAKESADVAMEGKSAAEARDVGQIEEIGARLDETCDACHAQFGGE
jgi:hypothetical protein